MAWRTQGAGGLNDFLIECPDHRLPAEAEPAEQGPADRGWMPSRSSSGPFGPALRPGSSTGVLHAVLLRGIDRRALVFVLGISSQVIPPPPAGLRRPPPSGTCVEEVDVIGSLPHYDELLAAIRPEIPADEIGLPREAWTA